MRRPIVRVALSLGLMLFGSICSGHAAQVSVPDVALLSERARDTPILICGILEVCLAAVYIGLSRAAPEYRVFVLMGLSFVGGGVQQLWRYFDGTSWDGVFWICLSPLLVATAAEAMRFPRRRWTLWLAPLYLCAAILPSSDSFAFWASLPVDVSQVVIAIFIVERVRRRKTGDLWVAGAFTLFFLVRWTTSGNFRRLTSLPDYGDAGGYRWYFIAPAMILLGIVTLVVYVRDLLKDRRQREQLAAEMEAGRAVQQMLFSQRQPAGGMWQIDPVYVPATEVGGDFYALLDRGADTSMLVIGDVSGRGLRAAMVVSAVLGALRQDAGGGPAEVLERLNRTLGEIGFGGFVKCLCMELGPEPELRFATAGHLSPYLNGAEIEAEGSLPLGIVIDSEYPEQRVTLASGDRVLLLSDGVVEAQNASGELFGFQRARLLSRLTAQEMVAAAQRFGQLDDITVVTVTRCAGAETMSASTGAVSVETPA